MDESIKKRGRESEKNQERKKQKKQDNNSTSKNNLKKPLQNAVKAQLPIPLPGTSIRFQVFITVSTRLKEIVLEIMTVNTVIASVRFSSVLEILRWMATNL